MFLNVEIEKLSLGGSGIAKHQGLVIFVPFSAPGDQLKIKVLEQKKNFAKAEIVEILKPGPSRITAPCQYFGRCGGCNWQHVDYSEQLKQKELIVREQLRDLITDQTEVLPIQKSPQDLRYRNRIQLHFDGQNLGFRERKSHKTIDVIDCLITEEKIASEFQKIKGTLKNPQRFELSLSLKGDLMSSLQEEDDEAQGFSQVNRFQNENLISQVLAWTADRSFHTIWDLYAGAGNFSFPLLKAHKDSLIMAAELNSASVASAQEELKKMNISPKKARFFLSDVGLFLRRMQIQESDLVLLDPPRTGCSDDVIENLASQKYAQMIYISCNPATLARDLKRLQQRNPKIRLKRVQAFDMFPQTDHVEVLTELMIDTI